MFNTNEVQFLASIIESPTSISSLPREITVRDFSDTIYYDIYLEIVKSIIDQKPLSYPDLRFKFKDDSIALSLLSEIEKTPPVKDVNYVYNDVLEKSTISRLKELASSIYHSCDSDFTSQDLIQKMESELLKLTVLQETKVQSLSDIEVNFLPNLQDKVKRFRKHKDISDIIDLPTGFSQLDKLTLGFQKGNTWVLGASTSDGKTQMAVQLANSVVNKDKGVLYFLLEDSAENLVTRFLSLRTGVPIENIRCGMLTDAQVQKVTSAMTTLKQMNCIFIDDNSTDINDIIAKTKFIKIKHPHVDLVVVDYIGLVSERGARHSNREQELSSVSKTLIALSKACNIAVLSLAQLNTSPENRGEGLPIRMNDIRDSKAIGFDAAVTMFIHYPDKYNKEKKFSKKHAQLIIAKNRYGEVHKTIELTNHANVAKFTEGAPRHEEAQGTTQDTNIPADSNAKTSS